MSFWRKLLGLSNNDVSISTRSSLELIGDQAFRDKKEELKKERAIENDAKEKTIETRPPEVKGLENSLIDLNQIFDGYGYTISHDPASRDILKAFIIRAQNYTFEFSLAYFYPDTSIYALNKGVYSEVSFNGVIIRNKMNDPDVKQGFYRIIFPSDDRPGYEKNSIQITYFADTVENTKKSLVEWAAKRHAEIEFFRSDYN